MDFTMQQLEDMDELDRLYLFEDIPEEDLKAHIESLPEDEREALLALIPEEVRCDMGYASDQQEIFSEISTKFNITWPKPEDFGGFSGRYGQKYKDWLEAYCPEEFWELVCKKELGAVCKAKNEEVADFIDDTVKALLVKNPAPDQKGVVFCTGTPISNSAAELYTMMRYIQADTLREHGLYAFDAWAANFGETVSAMELAPEGTGYRMKTRFARFNNLPELISMWKLAADVQTADMLKLEVPELEGGKPTVIMCPPTELQKHTIQALGERAEAVRAGSVDPHMDNMLKIVRC